MNSEIGALAGNIWNLLNKKGPQTATQIKNQTKESDFNVAAAIGWLAREGKIDFKKSAKSIKISLI